MLHYHLGLHCLPKCTFAGFQNENNLAGNKGDLIAVFSISSYGQKMSTRDEYDKEMSQSQTIVKPLTNPRHRVEDTKNTDRHMTAAKQPVLYLAS